MDLKDLGEKFPDFPYLMQIDGSAFEALLGAGWARENPKVPVLMTLEEMQDFAGKQQLEMPVVGRAIERFLGDPRTLEDRTETVAAVRAIYRDLFLKFVPGFWKGFQAQMTAPDVSPAEQARLGVLALSVWAADARKDPQAWKLWFIAGYAFVQLGEKPRAARFLAQAIAAYPNAVPALNELAALLLEEGKREEGGALVNKVLELEPDNITALCNAAGLLLETGRPQEALALLERAKALRPQDPHIERLLKLATQA